MMNTDLRQLLIDTAGHEMTPEERRAQAISFAYGNAAASNPAITREMVERAMVERRADETHATYKRSPSSYDEGAADALDVLLAEMRRTT